MTRKPPSRILIEAIKKEGVHKVLKHHNVYFCGSCEYVFLDTEVFITGEEDIACIECEAPEHVLISLLVQDAEEMVEVHWKEYFNEKRSRI